MTRASLRTTTTATAKPLPTMPMPSYFFLPILLLFDEKTKRKRKWSKTTHLTLFFLFSLSFLLNWSRIFRSFFLALFFSRKPLASKLFTFFLPGRDVKKRLCSRGGRKQVLREGKQHPAHFKTIGVTPKKNKCATEKRPPRASRPLYRHGLLPCRRRSSSRCF